MLLSDSENSNEHLNYNVHNSPLKSCRIYWASADCTTETSNQAIYSAVAI